MNDFTKISEDIKHLKEARRILNNEYEQTEFHKKKEANPRSSVPPSPDDEEAIKLLTTIQRIDQYIKKYQDEQLKILKEEKV